jgi:hypothetical protein
MKKNKRASLGDLAYIIYVIAGFSLLLLIFGTLNNAWNDKMQALPNMPDAGKTAQTKINNLYSGVLDNSVLFLVIGMCIAALVLAMMVVIHPVFFVLYFILLGVVIYVGAVGSNMYQYAASEPSMQAMAERLVMTSYVCQYLPFLIGAFGFLIAIVMYKSWRNTNG